MKYLGMDLGSKTLGLSISDKTGLIANPYKTIRYENYDELLNELDKIIKTEEIDKIVLGNPLNLDGSLSDRSKESLFFKEKLENKFGKEVIMQDERLTTVEAEKILISNNTTRKKRKKVVDTIAAVIILENYLNRK